MPDEDKTFSGFLVLDLRIWWRHVHTLYTLLVLPPCARQLRRFPYCNQGKHLSWKRWLTYFTYTTWLYTYMVYYTTTHYNTN